MRGLSERVGPAWGTSAERKYEWSVEAGEKGRGTGGSAPLWQAACSHMHSDAETLQRRCKFQRGAQRRVIPMSGLERFRSRTARAGAAAHGGWGSTAFH